MTLAPGGGTPGSTGTGNSKTPPPSRYRPPNKGPVTWREIYQLLIDSGYSTTQAIGIMANMINESQGNPEARAKDSNGAYSNGLVQWNEATYPQSYGLVTGNPQKDVRAQIKYLHQTAGKSAVAGRTPAEVAGNFAAQFEQCQGCQKGGAQHDARVANAATVAGWVAKGKWPAAGGGPGPTTGQQPTPQPSSNSGTCVLSAPSFFGFSLGGCLFSKTEARALIGGLIGSAGMLTGTLGVAVLVVSAFGKTKAGKAAGKIVSKAPQGRALKAVTGAGKAASGASKVSEQVAQERHTANQYRRQSAARKRYERDEGRAEEARETGRERARRLANPPKSPEPVPF